MILQRISIAAFSFLLITSISGCDLSTSHEGEPGVQDPTERRELPRQLTTEEMQIVEGSGAFGFDLIHKLLEKDSNESHFVSPLSILMAYGMTMNGADGNTYTQMQDAFGLENMNRDEVNQAARELIDLLSTFDEQVRFDIANSIWYRDGYPVDETFLEANQNYFDAVIESVDFGDPATVERINKWVSDNTGELIEEIVEPPIPPQTVMYLINAIYFKGDWTLEFDPEETRSAPFHRPDRSTSEVDMMVMQNQENLFYADGEDFQAVNLYYGDAGYAMTLVLPNEGVSLEEWVSGMNWQQWKELTGQFNTTKLTLEMPKFELEYEVDQFETVMQELGIVDAFGGQADFSRITGGPNGLYIDESRHKTFISVDEEGTEAAAATSVAVVESAGLNIRFNRPFFYVIREVESGSILFMGTMTDPSS